MSSYNMQQSLNGNFHEVAAVILVERKSKTVPQPKLSVFEQLLGLANNPDPLLLRRAWYAVDQSIDEADLLDDVKTVYSDRKKILSLYERLEQNFMPAQLTHDTNLDGRVREALDASFPPVITLEVEPDSYDRSIKLGVPFAKLQKTLLRYASSLERSAQGFLREVTITHAPLHDRNKVRVEALLQL